MWVEISKHFINTNNISYICLTYDDTALHIMFSDPNGYITIVDDPVDNYKRLKRILTQKEDAKPWI